MWQQIGQMRDAIALAEAQAPITDLTRLAERDRMPDSTLFSIGCQRLTAPDLLLNDLQEWIAAANLQSDHVELHGDEHSRHFILQFKGDRAVAIPRALALSRALRDAAGKWKRFSSTGTTGQYADIYVTPDKSAKQVRTEIQCKKLQQLLQHRYSDKQWRAIRTKGEIHCNAMPVIRLGIRGQADPAILEWNDKAFEHQQFQYSDRGAVLASFQALFADTESATWRT